MFGPDCVILFFVSFVVVQSSRYVQFVQTETQTVHIILQQEPFQICAL